MNLDPKTWWYVTRAGGYVSWALLAIAVLWGLFITNRTLTKSAAPAWVLDLHRHLGGLAVVFVAIHVGALPLDGYTHWSWGDLFVPMATTWHPVAIAFGIVAMYLLIAIEVTSLLGRRFPKKWWRRVHMLSFPLYVIASIHLFAAGTDSANVVARWMVVTTSTLIVFLTVVRGLAAAKPREKGANPRIAAARAAAATIPSATATVAEPVLAALAPVAIADASDDLLPVTASAEVTHPTPIPRSMTPIPIDARVARIRRQSADAAARARRHAPATATSTGDARSAAR